MEEQPQTIDLQGISHQHDNGEIFEANNLEAARGMCTVLGKMSLEEAGLLLELETIGKEQLADQQKAPTEKPLIEKVEKVLPKNDVIKRIAEPETKEAVREIEPEPELLERQIVEAAVKEIGDSIVSKPAESDLQAMHIQQAEAARMANNAVHESEEVDEAPIVKTMPAEIMQTMSKDEEVHHQVDAVTFEVKKHQETQSTVEEQAPVKNEYGINLSDVSPSKQPHDAQAVTERETADALLKIDDVKLASADEATLGPVTFESEEEAVSVNVAELTEPETLVVGEQDIDVDTFDSADITEIIEGMEPDYFGYSDEEKVLTEIMEATQLPEDETKEFIEVESIPQIEIAELPAPVAQIETTMMQLVEALENDDDETAKINTILEEIITLPTKLEVAADNEEKVLEEKLEDLFIELFEEAGISYSPDLIESFVKLTKSHYLEQLLEITADAEEAADLPQEIGTREFLQKLQHGLSAMKQAVINFYELGKSIMHLYTFSYQTANFRVT